MDNNFQRQVLKQSFYQNQSSSDQSMSPCVSMAVWQLFYQSGCKLWFRLIQFHTRFWLKLLLNTISFDSENWVFQESLSSYSAKIYFIFNLYLCHLNYLKKLFIDFLMFLHYVLVISKFSKILFIWQLRDSAKPNQSQRPLNLGLFPTQKSPCSLWLPRYSFPWIIKNGHF